MQVAPQQPHPGPTGEAAARAGGSIKPIIDLGALDLSQRLHSREGIARQNPHRGDMALLDWIIWTDAGFQKGVALKQVRADEFWVPGHFPAKAMLPGVLMIEAGAQLACFLYNCRQPSPQVVAFTRIEEASFRNMVQPGDDLYLLCSEVKFGRRRFISDIQGVVGEKIAFDARISGMSVE